MSLLQTEVLPIEYDEKTKRKANRIKDIIELNPEFFKVFLQGHDKISCIDQNNSLYIEKGQSILKYLDGISAYDATGFLYPKYQTQESGAEVLLFWLNEHYQGPAKYRKEERIRNQKMGILDYYHSNKKYQELYNYLHKREPLPKREILSFLQNQYRYPLTNILLEDDLMSVIEQYYIPTVNPDPLDLLDCIIWTSEEMSTIEDNFKYFTQITYPVSKEQSMKLFKRFLAEIDPTLSLLEQLNIAEQEKRFIDRKSDRRVLYTYEVQRYPNNPFFTTSQEEQGYIYIPWTNTIDNVISLVHEFFHYVVNKNEHMIQYELIEFPSIFFESLACNFLLQEGYPKEVIEDIKQNRKISTVNNANDIIEIATLMKYLYVSDMPISIEDDIELLDDNPPRTREEREEQERIAIRNCDRRNQLLVEAPNFVTENFPYIIAQKYSDILMEALPDNSNIIPNMITLLKEFETVSTTNLLEKVGIKPKQKQKIYQRKEESYADFTNRSITN